MRLPCWRVTFILHGASLEAYTPAELMDAHSQDSKPIFLGHRWQLKMHCIPITAGNQNPPSRKALPLYHNVPVYSWLYFCLHQKYSIVE